MKQYLFTILAILAMPLQAQNEFRIGDVLHSQQITYKSFDKTEGQDLIWDMNGCKVLNNDYQVRFVDNRDTSYHATLSRLEAGTNYRYETRNDSVLLMGFKNKSVWIKYDSPMVFIHLPLSFNDKQEGCYYGKGMDTMDNQVSLFGKYRVKVCGKGTLITLDGDTLPNTLLVHSYRTIASAFTPSQDTIENCDISNHISMLSSKEYDEKIEQDSNAIILDDYKWYAPGYRYAVFETIKAASKQAPLTPIMQTAFYYSIDDQENLPEDEANKAIRDSFARSNTSTARTTDYESRNNSYSLADGKVNLSISKNSNGIKISIDYRAENDDRLGFAIYDLNGVQLFKKDLGTKKKGLYNDLITVSNLFKGVYILTFYINGTPYSVKITI